MILPPEPLRGEGNTSPPPSFRLNSSTSNRFLNIPGSIAYAALKKLNVLLRAEIRARKYKSRK